MQEWETQCREKRTLEEFNEVWKGGGMKLSQAARRTCRGYMWWIMGIYKNKGRREKGQETVCILCGGEMEFAHFMKGCNIVKQKVEKYMETELKRKLEGENQKEGMGRIIAKNIEKGGSLMTVCNIIREMWRKSLAEQEMGGGAGGEKD